MVRIAAAQTPEFVDDLDAAFGYLLDVARQARDAALLCFPEGFLQGYLTEADAARRAALDLAGPRFGELLAALPQDGPMIVVGLIEADGEHLYNTAAVIHRRGLVGRYRKRHLLGRERCFRPGSDVPTFEAGGLRFGINICFDTNFAEAAMSVAEQGASLLLCPANNMLPRPAAIEWRDKHNAVRGERCRETGLWLMSADVTGERGGLVGWGPTAVLTPDGEVAAQLALDAPGLLVFDMPATARGGSRG
ncbi:carbon-nitrogen hydrolase family protein [Phenylobacterium sp. LjRoot164]|uniref:carbon-nitrogen hydrolase family protein n=1 Tax=unclassified Phenylobacterium TaxID=2640670 RepID=UPI003ECC8630